CYRDWSSDVCSSDLVLDTLIALLKDPGWRVRWKVLKSFERLSRVGPLPEKARAALFEYARGELAAFRQSLLTSRALVPRPGDESSGERARGGGSSSE